MNIVILIGRLVADPELKYTQGGKAFSRFTLAVSRTRQDADFINCVAWEKDAELIGDYTKKGNKIGIQGRLEVRSYEDSSNLKRRITEVVVTRVELLESKTQSEKSNVNSFSQKGDIEDDGFPF
ncbi:MAG: single-stranded DNA-binding protein [Fusobacteria bacterium]|nr:single-stranded DNA-binding protein [Fusobacteriota bacterium]